MTLYTLHQVNGFLLFAVMAGLIVTGLVYKFSKVTPLRIKAKKLHLKLAYTLIVLFVIQCLTILQISGIL